MTSDKKNPSRHLSLVTCHLKRNGLRTSVLDMSHVAKEMKRLMGKAVHSRDMIQDGDHVMVAVSGGKDSLSLLWLLRERLARVPINYQVTAVHVDPGFGAGSAERMEEFFSAHGFESRVVRGDFGPMAHGPENRENPCFSAPGSGERFSSRRPENWAATSSLSGTTKMM